jgi:hypothetical protein
MFAVAGLSIWCSTNRDFAEMRMSKNKAPKPARNSEWWQECAEPEAMNDHFGKRFTERKSRLIMLACCQRHPGFMKHSSVRPSLAMLVKHYADPNAPNKPLDSPVARTLHKALDKHTDQMISRPNCNQKAFAMRCAVLVAAEPASVMARQGYTLAQLVYSCIHSIATANVKTNRPDPAEWAAQADILREVLGNPFKPVKLKPAWLTDTVVALARHAYQTEDFSTLPILADALQDAGCENEDILNHCRDPKQVHVRGCWVVDLVLQK